MRDDQGTIVYYMVKEGLEGNILISKDMVKQQLTLRNFASATVVDKVTNLSQENRDSVIEETEEMRKLREVFESGFIMEEEYQARRKLIGI